MGMFKWATEESGRGSALAGSLALGALAANPAAAYVREKVLAPRYFGLESEILQSAGELTLPQVKALKAQMIDKSIRDKLLVMPARNAGGGAFVSTPKNYLPARSEMERLISKGGLQTFEGVADPIKAVRAIRETGGFVALPQKGSHAVTLAHELGHATSRNPGNVLRRSFPYKHLDALGRKAIFSGNRGALAAALLAGSFNSDDNRKWLVPGALGLTQAAVLGEEALASRKAISALDALKNTMGARTAYEYAGESTGKLFHPALIDNAGKSLRRAWGTYGLSSLGLLAAPLLAIKARDVWDSGHQ